MVTGESLDDLAKRIGAAAIDLRNLGNRPDPECKKCSGKGYRHPGMNSKRFIPCDCTNPEITYERGIQKGA